MNEDGMTPSTIWHGLTVKGTPNCVFRSHQNTGCVGQLRAVKEVGYSFGNIRVHSKLLDEGRNRYAGLGKPDHEPCCNGISKLGVGVKVEWTRLYRFADNQDLPQPIKKSGHHRRREETQGRAPQGQNQGRDDAHARVGLLASHGPS